MIIKVLGILDILIGLIFWLFGMFHISFLSNFMVVIGLFLLVKGVVFIARFNITSALDIVSGLIIITAGSFTMPKLIVVIVAIFLIQKGVISLMS